ncbi:PleD family two-component system response regulator [Oceanibaculum pacificum]|uniref:diguanylate cyclase n=1 Tax=Oceanibaculum pacificum TaxID=580166 RepID=A0A154W843_9PROT|nr:PleD family two-component system response regulator [Oceanibaculum pacificum]KZD09671.1 diguanylate cyclase response regulator [Oceanibaculum pacificum]
MPGRVLVVDDVLPNVKLLEAKLSAEYFNVITAMNGPDALILADKESPDIILLDIMMPAMDGFEVCRRLKANVKTQHIPVVMVTALSDNSDRVKGLESGADDFLTKPVNDIALFARVRSLVRLKTMMDEWRLREQTSHELGVMLQADQVKEVDTADAAILIVEDNPIDIANIEDILRAGASRIDTEMSPTKGVERAATGDYDLVITSLGLSQGDALRVCSQLRAQEKTRQVPILLVGEDDQMPRIAKGLDLGVNDYLIKPIDRNELMARVRTQIRRRRYQDRLRDNYEKSLSLALTDSLTGLYNRRYLFSHLQGLTTRTGGSNKAMSILLMDLDHFKRVNDTYGHVVGDDVLREIAKRILVNVRNFDLVARLGGEEFVIVMPDADREIAERVAERLRRKIAEAPFMRDAASTESIDLSVSIGIADNAEVQGDPTELLRRADIALYHAKNAGRNCVRLYDPAIETPGNKGVRTLNSAD